MSLPRLITCKPLDHATLKDTSILTVLGSWTRTYLFPVSEWRSHNSSLAWVDKTYVSIHKTFSTLPFLLNIHGALASLPSPETTQFLKLYMKRPLTSWISVRKA